MSTAGRATDAAPGPDIAAVSTAGYFGFLIGPPAIGFLAEAMGLDGALYVVLLSATIAALSRTVGTAARGKGEE